MINGRDFLLVFAVIGFVFSIMFYGIKIAFLVISIVWKLAWGIVSFLPRKIMRRGYSYN